MDGPKEGGRPPRHVGFRWADNILAPRQEIDALSLMYEEASIQATLDSAEQVDAATFLDIYQGASSAYRSGSGPLTPSTQQTAALTEQVAVFGAQASARARRQSGARGVLSCSCPDHPGVLADITEGVAERGGNLEGAFMSVVAGHFVTALLVSGAPAEKSEGADADLAAVLSERLEVSAAWVPLAASDVAWPRPGSSCWHLNARHGGTRPLLSAVTRVVAGKGLPLVAMSSWIETTDTGTDVQVADLNFAVAPSGRDDDLRVARAVERGVRKGVPGVQLAVAPVAWPTRYQPEGMVVGAQKRDLVVTVVGLAQPGFVFRVLRRFTTT